MAENTIVARPYARAVFELARDHDAFPRWAEFLALASLVAEDDGFLAFMRGPDADPDRLASIVIDACGDRAGELQQNFIRVLAENRRLGCLPEIAREFTELRDEYENIVEVYVTSAVPLNETQKQEFAAAMKRRLGKDVRLNCDLDDSLIGGAIIRSGDVVIDGSLRGRIERLADAVTH